VGGGEWFFTLPTGGGERGVGEESRRGRGDVREGLEVELLRDGLTTIGHLLPTWGRWGKKLKKKGKEEKTILQMEKE